MKPDPVDGDDFAIGRMSRFRGAGCEAIADHSGGTKGGYPYEGSGKTRMA